MPRSNWIRTFATLFALAALAAAAPQIGSGAQAPGAVATNVTNAFAFQTTTLDAGAVVGWVLSADMDADGDSDLVAGGGNSLVVFRNDGGTWTRTENLDPTQSLGSNGAVLFDVDRDRDIDVISSRYADDIGWWENPNGPGTISDALWTFHALGPIGDNSYMHDIMLADLDGDGRRHELVVVQDIGNNYWNAHIRIEWFRPAGNVFAPWARHVIEPDRFEGPGHSHAGIDVADIDRDGHPDLAFADGWYEAPDTPQGTWTWHQISNVYGISNTLARDLDLDGDPDLVMAAGHHGTGIYWYENALASGGGWTEHVVDAGVEHPEGLQVVDLDQDGVFEILAAEIFFQSFAQPVHHLYVYENQGAPGAWARQNISPNGDNHHLFRVVQVTGDCKLDVISQTAGSNVVSVLENVSVVPSCP
jgi:hypothetical protein